MVVTGSDTNGSSGVPRVLFARLTTAASLSPWYDDFVEAIDGAFEIVFYDPSGSTEEQFRDVLAVVDLGGFAPNEFIDAGADAGVRLWQVMGYGLEHIDGEHVKERGLAFARSPGDCTEVSLGRARLSSLAGGLEEVEGKSGGAPVAGLRRPVQQ